MARNRKPLDRIAVINALRSHAHPSWFHILLSWETTKLRALLAYYMR